MNHLLRALWAIGGGGSNPAPPPSPPGAAHAYNLAVFSYYSGVYPFIDVTKVGPGFFQGGNYGPQNADRWLTALPAGATAAMKIVQVMDPFYGYFPPGDYKIESSSAATLNAQASPGVSARVAGVGSATFTFTAQPGAWDAVSIFIDITNNTGSAIAVTDVKCFLASEESLLDAGEIFKPAFLADIAGAQTLRFMDWTQTNSLPAGALSEMGTQVESRNGYAPDRIMNVFVPFSICMKLAKKVGAKPWICVPQGGGWRFVDTVAATSRIVTLQFKTTTGVPFAHGLAENDRIMLYGYGAIPNLAPLVKDTVYYAKNVTATDLQVSLTSGGAPVTFTSGVNGTPASESYVAIASLEHDAQTNMRLPIAAACFAADPAATVYVENSNEVWNSGFDQYRYARSVGGFHAGGIGNTPHGYALQSLLCWKAFETYYPAAQVVRVYSGQVASFAALREGFEYVDPGIISTGLTVKAIMAASLSRSIYGIAPYINAEVNPGDQANTVTPNIAYVANGNSTAIPDAYWDAKFGNGITTAAGWVASSVTNVRLKVPNIPIVCYEWGHQFRWTGSDANAVVIGRNLMAYLDSAAGSTMYQAAWAAHVDAYGVVLVNHYYSASNPKVTSGKIEGWGIKNVVDTPRFLWFQTK